MLDVCNDARNKAEVFPQIYNAWGIRYMGYCRLLASRAQYDTPIPLEYESLRTHNVAHRFQFAKVRSTVWHILPNVNLHSY